MNPIIAALKKCDDAYYNNKPIMSDASYDIIYQAAEKVWPKEDYFQKVGAPVPGEKVKLFAPKGRMPQQRPDEAVAWFKKSRCSYIIMPKIDGISGQLIYKNGKFFRAITRGDGSEGKDVTAFAKYVIGVWPTLKGEKWKKKTIIIDIEFSMHRGVFRELNLDKFANTRTLCNGMLNRNVPDEKLLGKMVAIAYSWQEEGKNPPKIFEQLNNLANEGFFQILNCAPIRMADYEWLQANQMRAIPNGHTSFTKYYHDKPVTKEWLLATLKHLRELFDLDLDGLVATLDVPQKPGKVYTHKIKPDRADQVHAKGTIKMIEWNMSSRSLMIPVAILKEPVNFNGTFLKRATLDNYARVKEMQIGPGSVVDMVKAGDVIPKVERVVKARGFEPYKYCPSCKKKLKFTGTHLMCANEECKGSKLPLLINFFKKLKTDELGEGTLTAFANAGFDSVAKVLAMRPKQMAKLDRMGEKSAANIIASIKKVMGRWRLHEFMAASGIFADENTSLGDTLIRTICGKYSINDFRALRITAYDLMALPNIGETRAELFVQQLPEFVRFYDSVRRAVEVKFQTGGILSHMTFCFTNFRDNEMEELIKKHGGKMSNSMTLSTNVLFFTGSSVKTKKADDLIHKGADVKKVPAEKSKVWLDKLIADLEGKA
jgi:DNA ligase (NAD+)